MKTSSLALLAVLTTACPAFSAETALSALAQGNALTELPAVADVVRPASGDGIDRERGPIKPPPAIDLVTKGERVLEGIRMNQDKLSREERSQVSQLLGQIERLVSGNSYSGHNGAAVICAPTGYERYSLFTTGNEQIGTGYYGSLQNCNAAVTGANRGAVCVVTGYDRYTPFSIAAREAIGDGYFGSLANCNASLAAANRERLLCSPTGYERYSVFSIETQAQIGDGYYGSLGTCNQAVSGAKNGIVCLPTGYQRFSPFLIDSGTQIGSGAFGTLAACLSSIGNR